MDALFLAVTYLGSPLVICIITTLSCISFVAHRQHQKALRLLFSVCSTAFSVYILKMIFDRPRPEWALYMENSASFPSGHAALGIALYGFIFYSILKHNKHPLKNKTLVMLGLIVALVGLSRVYLGVHYLSDVIVGYTIGLIWLFIATKLKIS